MKETGSATALNLSFVVGVLTANEKEREICSMLCCGMLKLVKSIRNSEDMFDSIPPLYASKY